MDPTAARLFRRYTLAGVAIAGGVVAGAIIGQRQHEAEFPARDLPAVPCVEACAKRAACRGEDAVGAARCATLCNARSSGDPEAVDREARCLLDHACAEQGACGDRW